MDLAYWLLLLKAPHLGIKTFYKALQYFETPQQVFLATHSDRFNTGLFKKSTLIYLASADIALVQADLDWMQKENCHILTLIDKRYPSQLKTISDPPPILYVRGDVDCLQDPQLAIVGSRNPTTGGEQNAQQFAADLAKLGLVITSGMASGIDAQAHIGALEQGAKTIAVCGTGLDRIYPAKHKSLAHQISMQGALISEFFIGTSPMASNFPRRNRLISGLSLGTLVVEASIKSGTMITAKLAAEQGKEVFAIPSSIHNPLSEGCHYLINQGAKLVSRVNDIVEELPKGSLSDILPQKNTDSIKEMDKTGSKVLKCLSYEPLSVDQLVEKTQLSPQIVSQELLLLELAGKLEKTQAQGYVLIK
ncbi:DNA-processing protein DprA [Candidatus Thioglobus autotrophicus]|uniref:DNA-processing protein DprA n=1 Tax=Candidatus Thioglobus autotrophicus TaxID=1705394 RepID=UPI00299E22E8|nr:DNA-processing protein DprA [Candidatus Thioglobus autotrophicus]WPE16415.1 DNA-processing protein DprA [Candidatus Thioglobus autotrophicus]WPE17963.1 DNA-processing protein DprA [Candidatus Thioglobus autotrophicus]